LCHGLFNVYVKVAHGLFNVYVKVAWGIEVLVYLVEGRSGSVYTIVYYVKIRRGATDYRGNPRGLLWLISDNLQGRLTKINKTYIKPSKGIYTYT